jgi:hypothetical protein
VDGNQHHICTRILRWRSYKILWWVTSKVSRRRLLPPEPWYSVRLVLISYSAFAVCCMICVVHTFHIVKLWAYLHHCMEKKSFLFRHVQKRRLFLPLFSFLRYLPKLKMRIFPNYLKNGGRHMVLDALWSHTKLYLIRHFPPPEICPHGPQKSPQILIPDDKLLCK